MPVLEEVTESAILARLEIQRSLGRVEGKLDQIITGMASHESLDKDRFADANIEIQMLDKRVAGLERKVWYASGVVGVLVFALSHLPFNLLWK
jgi:hypothetical protein